MSRSKLTIVACLGVIAFFLTSCEKTNSTTVPEKDTVKPKIMDFTELELGKKIKVVPEKLKPGTIEKVVWDHTIAMIEGNKDQAVAIKAYNGADPHFCSWTNSTDPETIIGEWKINPKSDSTDVYYVKLICETEETTQ